MIETDRLAVAHRKKLLRSFYDRPTLDVAFELLGKLIVFASPAGNKIARIVETEAYIGRDDPACHAARGMTKRNHIMFGKPGHSYIYFIYGMYNCLNVVTETEGIPAAVLIRGAEPVSGFSLEAQTWRKKWANRPLGGPGKLCREFGLTREHSELDLTGSLLFLADDHASVGSIVTTQRIGIKAGADLPYRFYIENSPGVSKKA